MDCSLMVDSYVASIIITATVLTAEFPCLQDVIALVRPISVHKPAIRKLEERGVKIRKCDLKAPEEHLIEALADIDVVISCVGPAEQQDQIPLAKAAKQVGVKRFIPCGFITVAPPGGVMWLRDEVCGVWLCAMHRRLT